MTVMMPTPTGGLNTHSQNLLVSALLNLKLVQPPPPAEDETTWSGASLQADCKQRPWQTVLTTLNTVGNEAYYQPPPRSARPLRRSPTIVAEHLSKVQETGSKPPSAIRSLQQWRLRPLREMSFA